jgi:hypothetical protein
MDMKTLWKDQSLTHINTNYQQTVIQEKNLAHMRKYTKPISRRIKTDPNIMFY